jgi:hypothetical protein
LRKSSYFTAIALLITMSTGFSESIDPANTVLKYYEASREGDVSEIKQLIAGSFYNRRKVLLETNDNYPDFLRSHYEDSAFLVDEVDISNDDRVAAVSVLITYASEGTEKIKLILKKDESNNWVIVDEVLTED